MPDLAYIPTVIPEGSSGPFSSLIARLLPSLLVTYSVSGFLLALVSHCVLLKYTPLATNICYPPPMTGANKAIDSAELPPYMS